MMWSNDPSSATGGQMLTESEIKAYTVDIPSDIQAAQRASGCASATGSAHDRNTAIIREECERRLAVIKNRVECAIFALNHMNPRLSTEYLDDVTRYGALAKLDTEELTRRLNTQNDKLTRDAGAKTL